MPDRVFLGYPPIETSFVILRWAKKNNIPLMLDVKDNWPENFIEPFPKIFKKFARLLLLPYFKLAKYIFNHSDSITSITNSFIDWIKLFSSYKNKVTDNKKPNFILAPLVRKKIILSEIKRRNSFYYWQKKGIDIMKGNHFAFVGSLSNSFDFNLIYEIANFLIKKYPNYFFIICGTGDRSQELKLLFKNSPNVIINGEVDQYDAATLLATSIASLAPYSNEKLPKSIPNKVIESLESGVPFITKTEGELKNLIEEYQNGIFLNKFDDIIQLIEDKEYLNMLRKNALKSYKKLFNFEMTYENIIFNLINI